MIRACLSNAQIKLLRARLGNCQCPLIPYASLKELVSNPHVDPSVWLFEFRIAVHKNYGELFLFLSIDICFTQAVTEKG